MTTQQAYELTLLRPADHGRVTPTQAKLLLAAAITTRAHRDADRGCAEARRWVKELIEEMREVRQG